MKTLFLLTALLTTSALADLTVKVNRIEASATEVANPTADAGKEVVDGKTSRANASAGDEAGTPNAQAKGRRLDADSDDDGLEDVSRKCGVDDDCDDAVNDTNAVATADAARSK